MVQRVKFCPQEKNLLLDSLCIAILKRILHVWFLPSLILFVTFSLLPRSTHSTAPPLGLLNHAEWNTSTGKCPPRPVRNLHELTESVRVSGEPEGANVADAELQRQVEQGNCDSVRERHKRFWQVRGEHRRGTEGRQRNGSIFEKPQTGTEKGTERIRR
jgi:hypothetical protein